MNHTKSKNNTIPSFNNSERESINQAFAFLKSFKSDIKKIERISGNERTEKLRELKRIMIEDLVNTAAVGLNLPFECKAIFKDEIMSIYNIE
ncbi:hypothetical protein B0O79_1012 [Flavobacteriaceae bacterium MAR_2009_75]|nr:hypothetical protein B0O79_1012 [Flavobacteriaceae bacterium MAR_2009_75]